MSKVSWYKKIPGKSGDIVHFKIDHLDEVVGYLIRETTNTYEINENYNTKRRNTIVSKKNIEEATVLVTKSMGCETWSK